jgi:hypothetical protein
VIFRYAFTVANVVLHMLIYEAGFELFRAWPVMLSDSLIDPLGLPFWTLWL